ncbi:MAG TPA: hypothetical protein PKY56_13290 [Candidatus Kapabacteria bacterium]|nr:hypothetical protein [Candidatus Kapabacteria bacterium]HPO62356.1 hypothetical protein [Candidatus Kapabacteria bacterium]
MNKSQYIYNFAEVNGRIELIKFLLDDLIKKIKMECSYNELLKRANRIKRTLKTE